MVQGVLSFGELSLGAVVFVPALQYMLSNFCSRSLHSRLSTRLKKENHMATFGSVCFRYVFRPSLNGVITRVFFFFEELQREKLPLFLSFIETYKKRVQDVHQ
jgi:hypothetical protein